MFLENVVFDATDPHTLGRFWEAVLGTETLTDEPDGYESRLAVPDGPVLDLGFQRVPDAPAVAPHRLHFDLHGGADQQQLVDRLLALGARHVDIGQGDVPWVVLADPAGNPFCVLEQRSEYDDAGLLAALPLAVADPEREHAFWAWLTGWVPVDGTELRSLVHPSRRGPRLEMLREPAPKGDVKNRIHLDIRLEPGDDVDAIAREVGERGGQEKDFGWGDLPWRHFADPSGNEFCLLPARG